jgi:rhodanese-related sulfurtransferase
MSSQDIHPASGYDGDISVQTAWRWSEDKTALIIDVRTDAEREWVGYVPGAVAVAWKQWPGMAVNAHFSKEVQAACQKAGVSRAALLCRSGVRSVAAALELASHPELGIEAFNILQGFEGDPDENAHRSVLGGWKSAGLPWRQN